jgi:general transcriptional corepressor TUP1
MDGKYLASGTQRKVQIFDLDSGGAVSQFNFDRGGEEKDVYACSICFSPDGMYLAAGCEDKHVRVSSIFPIIDSFTYR